MTTTQQFRMARAALGWTTRELAAKANIGAGTVCRLESGDNVLATSKEKLERVFAAEGLRFHKDNVGYGVYGPHLDTLGARISLVGGKDVDSNGPTVSDTQSLWYQYLEAKERADEIYARFTEAFLVNDGPKKLG